jgi:hypothetical protein
MRNLRAMDHGLRRRAADVDAGSPNIFFLDEGYRPSQIRKAKCEGITALSGADNDGVMFHSEILRFESAPRLYIRCGPAR